MSTCNIQTLASNAGCFWCLSPGERDAVKTALLCKIAQMTNSSVSCNPNSLMANAGGFATLDRGLRELVELQLLCEIRGSGGGNSVITMPSDTDAANFVCGWLVTCGTECTSTTNCAPSIPVPLSALCVSGCGITQKVVNAIQDLVSSLKSAGLWDLMDVIYPFVGGKAGPCSLNLKDFTKFQITWHGGVTFATAGVTGDGATGYGDTGFNPNTAGGHFALNSATIGVYVNGLNQADVMGAFSVIGSGSLLSNSITGIVGFANGSTTHEVGPIAYGAPTAGVYAISRTAGNLTTLYVPSGATATDATAASTQTAFSLYVLSSQFSGIPNSFSASTMGFAWAGSGFTGAQMAALNTIISTFIAAK